MTPRIETLLPKKLAGKHRSMSLAQDKTRELWRDFMTARNDIPKRIGTVFYSMQVHTPGYFDDFNPLRSFEKWACAEVSDFDALPAGMEGFTLPGGLYAVFLHKGAAPTAARTFQYIFGIWLPNSGYTLDHRPHFEMIGEKYKNDDPESEEEIWIPVRKKE